MKKTNISIAFLLCLFSIHSVLGQVVQPVNKEVVKITNVTNGQKFYDSGGPNGNYAICAGNDIDNEENCTSTITLCGAGIVCVKFITFSLFTGADKLSVYNGGPDGTLIAQGSAQAPLTGATFTSTAPDGCLTFKFFSTSINASIGWEADIILKTTTVEEQPGPDCNLVCSDHVNASMPSDTCYRVFTFEDFLVNWGVCNYGVQINYPFGTHRLNGNDVDRSHIGYTMVYSVFDLTSGNSCWGYLTVEDKAPPIPTCKTRAVSCFQVLEIQNTINTIVDNCAQQGNRATILSLVFTDLGCTSPTGYIGQVVRTIRNWDQWGNTGLCSDTLFIRRDSLEDVKCADLVELECTITCGTSVITFDRSASAIKYGPYKKADKLATGKYYPTPDLLLWLQANCGTGSGIDLLDKVVPEMRDSVVVLDFACSGPGDVTASGPGICIAQYCRLVDSCTPMWPVIGGFCKMTIGYTDEILEICPGGAGFKIRRQWRIADWCTNTDTVCIQYIKVHDTQPPLVAANANRFYTATASAHDCVASLTIPAFTVTDCSPVDQTYVIEYISAGHPGRPVVLTGTLPATIKLPASAATNFGEIFTGGEFDFAFGGIRCFLADVTLVDRCYNRAEDDLLICVRDITPPTPVCDEFTQTTLDPATCWARVYAHDLDNGSRDNCCDVLHFAVAHMDTITKIRADYAAKITKDCGNAHYWQFKTLYDYVIEQYINCYVFKDYIDLGACGTNQVVLRVYEACGIPRYDPHVFECSEHDWYCYNAYTTYRIWRNYQKLHPSGAREADGTITCAAKPAWLCTSAYFTWLIGAATTIGPSTLAGFGKLLLPAWDGATYLAADILSVLTFGNVPLSVCTPFYFPETLALAGAQLFPQGQPGSQIFAPGNTCSALLYNDCMINILVDDKTPPVCEAPPTLYWYCDDAGLAAPNDDYEYAWRLCGTSDGANWVDFTCRDLTGLFGNPYNQVEINEDGVLTDSKDSLGIDYGWYGCNIYGDSHVDEHGEPAGVCESEDASYYNRETPMGSEAGGYGSNNWVPVYCHSWLLADRYDRAGQIDPKTRFYTPVLRSGGRGANAGPGQFIIWDNCTVPTVTSTDQDFIDNCGKGWIQRTWTIGANCGNATVTCTQKILTYHRSDFEVIFPADVLVNCTGEGNFSPDVTGRPIISDDECELVGVNFTDVRYDVIPDVCYKLVRTWTLIDWCKYDPNARYRQPEVIVNDTLVAHKSDRYCVYRNLKDDGDGYMTYTQIIKVNDDEAPTAGVIVDTTFCILGGYSGAGAEPAIMCSVEPYRSPNFTATDNCTPSGSIAFRYELDANFTSTVYKKADIDFVSGANVKFFSSSTLSVGEHRVYIIAEDNCGNEDTSWYKITVRDCKKPTPYCYNGIATVVMPSANSVTVWAKDLDAGSYDNCTVKASLKFSFDSAGTQTSRTFSCSDIPNGVSATIEVDIYVTDLAGNSDFCRTYILLQDGSGNRCTDVAGVTGSIAGKVTTESTEAVEHVILEAKSGSNLINTYKTDSKGTYSFTGLPMKNSYSITAKLDENPTNGVSTIDLVAIQKHILGVQGLSSAYKVIAADVDKSNDVTAVDLVELRKLILTVYDKLPNNTSWRFVPKTYAFSSVNNPWGFPEKIDIGSLTQDELNRDFIGIKVGDVNGTVVAHSLLGAETRDNGISLKFRTEDRQLKAGEEAVVEFTAENFRNIEGYQFSLALKGVELKGFNSGALKVTENNFGMTKLGAGYITTSWNESKGVNVNSNEVLFSIKVKATKATTLSESLVINSKYTRAEAYNGAESMGVTLEVGKSSVSGYALHQNTPNPFKASTVISYELAKSEKVTIKITDVTGRLVKVYTEAGVKGYNQFKVNRNDVSGAGVLYYTLETKDFSATKKMILVE